MRFIPRLFVERAEFEYLMLPRPVYFFFTLPRLLIPLSFFMNYLSEGSSTDYPLFLAELPAFGFSFGFFGGKNVVDLLKRTGVRFLLF
jgi:hypothetical protein